MRYTRGRDQLLLYTPAAHTSSATVRRYMPEIYQRALGRAFGRLKEDNVAQPPSYAVTYERHITIEIPDAIVEEERAQSVLDQRLTTWLDHAVAGGHNDPLGRSAATQTILKALPTAELASATIQVSSFDPPSETGAYTVTDRRVLLLNRISARHSNAFETHILQDSASAAYHMPARQQLLRDTIASAMFEDLEEILWPVLGSAAEISRGVVTVTAKNYRLVGFTRQQQKGDSTTVHTFSSFADLSSILADVFGDDSPAPADGAVSSEHDRTR